MVLTGGAMLARTLVRYIVSFAIIALTVSAFG